MGDREASREAAARTRRRTEASLSEHAHDDDRLIRGGPVSDDEPLLPEQTIDDTDLGWGRPADDDARLLQDRPPHWDNR